MKEDLIMSINEREYMDRRMEKGINGNKLHRT